jgi:hypothetical protein
MWRALLLPVQSALGMVQTPDLLALASLPVGAVTILALCFLDGLPGVGGVVRVLLAAAVVLLGAFVILVLLCVLLEHAAEELRRRVAAAWAHFRRRVTRR